MNVQDLRDFLADIPGDIEVVYEFGGTPNPKVEKEDWYFTPRSALESEQALPQLAMPDEDSVLILDMGWTRRGSR